MEEGISRTGGAKKKTRKSKSARHDDNDEKLGHSQRKVSRGSKRQRWEGVPKGRARYGGASPSAESKTTMGRNTKLEKQVKSNAQQQARELRADCGMAKGAITTF